MCDYRLYLEPRLPCTHFTFYVVSAVSTIRHNSVLIDHVSWSFIVENFQRDKTLFFGLFMVRLMAVGNKDSLSSFIYSHVAVALSK